MVSVVSLSIDVIFVSVCHQWLLEVTDFFYLLVAEVKFVHAERLVQEVMQETSGLGVDVVVDHGGKKAKQTVGTHFKSTWYCMTTEKLCSSC